MHGSTELADRVDSEHGRMGNVHQVGQQLCATDPAVRSQLRMRMSDSLLQT